MTVRIAIAKAAHNDIDEIQTWLTAVAGIAVATKYTARFIALYDRLSSWPDIGAPRPTLGSGIRVGIVTPFIVIYRHDAIQGIVHILRVVHGRRRIARRLLA